MRAPFQFKQFSVKDENSPMKVNTDAVLLGAWVNPSKPKKILDIGTGCGVIALLLAQRFGGRISGIDLDEGAIMDAKINFSESPWSERLLVIHQDFKTFSASSAQQFDLIATNPPYFENSLRSPKHARNISRHAETLNHQDLIKGSVLLLKPNGIFAVILPTAVFEIFEKEAGRHGLYVQRICLVSPVDNKPSNRVMATFSDEKPQIKIIEELTLHHPGHTPTEAYQKLTRDFYPHFD